MLIKVDSTNRLLYCQKIAYPCAIGQGGVAQLGQKIEGDGKTPLGVYPLLKIYYRIDRVVLPQTQIPTEPISKTDGWCDDPARAEYNQKIKLPVSFGHETMWRDDGQYDIVIVIGYNMQPIIRGKGSAIFWHIAKDDFSPTAGCIANKREDLLAIIPHLSQQSKIDIR